MSAVGQRPAEVVVGRGALGEQPAGLGGELDGGGERRVAVVGGVDPAAVEQPQVAAGAAGVRAPGCTSRVRMPAAWSAGVRSGASAAAMPNSSNQARVGRRRAAGQDRAGADGVHRRPAAAVVVGAEGQQGELGVLQRRRGGQQPGHLVHQLLQVVPHRVLLPPCHVVHLYESTAASSGHLSLARRGGGA